MQVTSPQFKSNVAKALVDVNLQKAMGHVLAGMTDAPSIGRAI